MTKTMAGILAGLIATLVLSAIMIMKSLMGIMPEVNAIQMLTGMAHKLMGLPQSPVVGWMIHLVIGVFLWGILFSISYSKLPTVKAWSKGVLFGIGAWLLMMVGPMPMAGAGLFGLNIGIQAPVATLVLHVVYGAALGVAFARFRGAVIKTDESVPGRRDQLRP